jgi:lipoyl(octanoyl) transferase
VQLVIEQTGLGGQAIEYQTAWDLQRDLHQQVVARQIPDTVLLLEHSSVYTAGRRTEAFERPTDGTPVVDVDRGGKITWHGPGQLIGYPIVHLPSPMDVVSHVRRLEDVLIGICSDFDLETSRVKGRSGVWVLDPTEDRKVAAIGVRVAQGVTMHGFALNCNNDLSWFDRIVPCGIRDAGVTTLSKEIGRDISIEQVAGRAEFHLRRVFGQIAKDLSKDLVIDA